MLVDPTTLLTVLGLALATAVARQRARRLGLDLQSLYSLMAWSLLGALMGGYMVDTFCYRLDEVIELVRGWVVWREPLQLLRVWHGWRSVGGLLGGVVAVVLWKRYRFGPTVLLRIPDLLEVETFWFVKHRVGRSTLALADVMLSVLPIVWILHRVGSAITPDGFSTTRVGRLDLVISSLLLVVLSIAWRRRFRAGWYVCLVGLTYPPARFALEFLREREIGPHVSAWLTPNQWGFALLTLLGVGLLLRLRWPSFGVRMGGA